MDRKIIGYCPKCGAPILLVGTTTQPMCLCAGNLHKTFTESFDLKK